MKYAHLSAFEKHLEGASPDHFADIYLILGKEDFVRKQGIDLLAKWVLRSEKMMDMALCHFDAERQPFEALATELETLSFFVKKRLLVVQNAESLDKAATTHLEAYFAAPNSTICLALSASALNRATNFYKKAEKAGIVLDVAEEKPWEKEKSLAVWLQQAAASHGKQMSPTVCQLLVKQLGTDQALLHNELQKLICFVGEKSAIEERDVSAVSLSINVETAWQLGEMLFGNDTAGALRICKGLLGEGTALIALLRQIRSQFQTEYQIASLLATGGTPADIAKEYPYMKGIILERHIRQAQSYGMPRFKKGILAIDETELQAKNSSLEADFLAEMLMIKLTT